LDTLTQKQTFFHKREPPLLRLQLLILLFSTLHFTKAYLQQSAERYHLIVN